MSKKLRGPADKVSEILADTGIKGLCVAATEKLGRSARQTFYRNRLLRKIAYPKLTVAYLELTDNCNLNCKMCTYKKEHGKTGYMSWSLFDSCVTQLSQMGIKSLCLHFGGESLLHPNFKDYLKHAIYHRDHGKIQNVSWIDNGMMFNQSIADLVVNLKVDAIGFSIDGIGQVNDNIRVGSNYSVIERNIKNLIERRNEAKKPEVFLSMCAYGKTKEQEMDVYREWTPFVDRITLIPSVSPDNTVDKKDAYLSGHKIAKPPAFCFTPFDGMAISWDGKVTACCLDYSFKMGLGDATKDSLKQIWHGSRYQTLRKAALANTFPVGSPCYRCEFWKINFKGEEEPILNGTATIRLGYIYKSIQKKKG